MRFPPTAVSLTFLLGLAFFYFNAVPLFIDADTPWHLAAGHWMLYHHQVPMQEGWSFTAAGHPWYLLSWAWDVIIAWCEHIGGLRLVYLLVCTVSALLLALLCAFLLMRERFQADALFFTLVMVGLALWEYANARSHLPGFVLLVLFHHAAHASRKRLRYLLWLPVIMAMWANIHGSFLAALTILGAYGLEALLNRRWRWALALTASGLASMAALLINPYGVDIVTGIVGTFGSVSHDYIMEWVPFTFSASLGLSLWMLMFLLTSNFRESRIPLADRILAFMWLIATFLSTRNGSLFILLSAPYMAYNLQFFAQSLPGNLGKAKNDKPLMPAKFAVLLTVLVSAGLLCPPVAQQAIPSSQLVPEGISAEKAIRLIQEQHGERQFLNDYHIGGQMAYFTQGRVPLFVDPRAGTAFPEEVLKDYFTVHFLKNGWQDVLKKYGVTGLLLRPDTPFSKAYAKGEYQKEWRKIYEDEAAAVFIRIEP